MNIKKTGKLMIVLAAGTALVKTLRDDKLKREKSEMNKGEIKEELK